MFASGESNSQLLNRRSLSPIMHQRVGARSLSRDCRAPSTRSRTSHSFVVRVGSICSTNFPTSSANRRKPSLRRISPMAFHPRTTVALVCRSTDSPSIRMPPTSSSRRTSRARAATWDEQPRCAALYIESSFGDRLCPRTLRSVAFASTPWARR